MRPLLALVLAGSLGATAASAEPGTDALGWLNKMTTAARRLSYTGTFTFQSGGNSETFRITHVVDGSGEHERLEVLDGSPREVVRNNEEVKCFLPDEKVILIESRGQQQSFPALLPSSSANLGEHYILRKGEIARVAGYESQQIVLEPRDSLRYGHALWGELNSGLILKARTMNERNEIIEQYAFNQLQIGGAIDRNALKPKFGREGEAWRVHNPQTAQSRPAGGEWQFRAQLPGFRKVAGMKRVMAGQNGTEISHFVFSDGLASISVFIEPLSDQKIEASTYSVGAINVYKRGQGQHLLTVLGEVPVGTLKQLGDGIAQKRK
jgi:sigma-E factor negative regulatory protein RseB